MNKIKLACFATILSAGIAHATSVPCDGFEIKIKNNLPDDFLVTQIKLDGANIQPGGIQKLNGHSEQVFTVNNSAEGRSMVGEFIFHTISFPSKEVTVKFDLNNKALVCHHTDHTVTSDYHVDKTRLPGKVTYTIG